MVTRVLHRQRYIQSALCKKVTKKKTYLAKVPVAYGRNSLSDLTSSNDVAKNGVNGIAKPGANKTWEIKHGNKTSGKCKYCAPMETSIEGICSLENP